MIETFVSKEPSALARGEAFGARFAAKIAANVEIYRHLFLMHGKRSLDEIRLFCGQAYSLVKSYWPSIADEIEGIARGANLPLSDVMALNARTELLAACGGLVPQECSVVIALGADEEKSCPLALQNWDWLSELSEGWLLWTIESQEGHVVRTLTEYGIVGKIGLNSAGVGALLNILSHEKDGLLPIGLPVHVAMRAILDERTDLHGVTARIASAPISASSAISVVARSGRDSTAFSMELFPGGPAYCLPSEKGLLIHTNHFLSPAGAAGDRALKGGSGSFSRYEQLRRRLGRKEDLSTGDVLQVLSGHVGGAHGICSHPVAGARLGEKSETLAAVQLDLTSGQLLVHKGGPCEGW